MKFLTTKKIAAGIEDVIKDSNDFITLVSPFIKLSQEYIEWLHEAADSGIKILIIYGKNDKLHEPTFEALRSIENLELMFYENLHAKCYLNENIGIITSMNLYEFSELNNREMGISIDATIDYEVYKQILAEIDSLKRNSTPIEFRRERGVFQRSRHSGDKTREKKKSSGRDEFHPVFLDGHCIRCGNAVILDPETPLCESCYNKWSFFGNPDYEENFCHVCGDKCDETTYRRPLCFDCFKEWVSG